MRSSGRGRAQRAEGELRRESGDVIVGLGLTVGLGPCPLLCLFYSLFPISFHFLPVAYG